MNNVALIGRLTKDAEIRQTQNGKDRASFTLAVDGFRKDDDADFIRCAAWGKTAELLAQYTHKGSRIGVNGRIHTYSYDSQQGDRAYVTEVTVSNVEFLDSKQQSNDSYQNNHNNYQNNNPAYQPPSRQSKDDNIPTIDDEDLPF